MRFHIERRDEDRKEKARIAEEKRWAAIQDAKQNAALKNLRENPVNNDDYYFKTNGKPVKLETVLTKREKDTRNKKFLPF